jgi:hypothetical protein
VCALSNASLSHTVTHRTSNSFFFDKNPGPLRLHLLLHR